MKSIAKLLALSLVLSLSACGGKEESSTSAAAEAKSSEKTAAYTPITFEPVGLPGIDGFFEKAKAPITSIDEAAAAITAAHNGINAALGLAEGAPLADALNDLKTKAEGKIKVAIDSKGVPSLSPADGCPENVKAALTGVNDALKNMGVAKDKLMQVIPQTKELVTAAAGLKDTLIADAKAAAKNPLEMATMGKTLVKNVNSLGKAPSSAENLVKTIDLFYSDLKAAFGG